MGGYCCTVVGWSVMFRSVRGCGLAVGQKGWGGEYAGVVGEGF